MTHDSFPCISTLIESGGPSICPSCKSVLERSDIFPNIMLDKLLQTKTSYLSSLDLGAVNSIGYDSFHLDLDKIMNSIQRKKQRLEEDSVQLELVILQSFLDRTKQEKLIVIFSLYSRH